MEKPYHRFQLSVSVRSCVTSRHRTARQTDGRAQGVVRPAMSGPHNEVDSTTPTGCVERYRHGVIRARSYHLDLLCSVSAAVTH